MRYNFFETDYLSSFKAEMFHTLSKIHEFLFSDIYQFAGKIRAVNIVKSNFRFAPLMYFNAALEDIEKMPKARLTKLLKTH